MQLNLDDSKEKPKRRGRTSPIDFVVPLQLEECIDRMEQSGENTTFQFEIDYDEFSDQVRFVIRVNDPKQTILKVTGMMQHLEENSTHFIGTVEFVRSVDEDIFVEWIGASCLYVLLFFYGSSVFNGVKFRVSYQ